MKQLFFRYTTGFIPFIALCTSSFAQTSKLSTQPSDPLSQEIAYNMESKTPGATVPPANPLANINTKAVKNFSRNYKNNAAWFEITDGYIAIFNEGGIKTKVYYDKKGRLVGQIRSYEEDKLPRDVRHLVKSRYYDFHINYVNELTALNTTVYLVKIEDSKSFKTIRVTDGEMTETEAFDKSK